MISSRRWLGRNTSSSRCRVVAAPAQKRAGRAEYGGDWAWRPDG
jgi:hypothetical protein